MQKLFSFTQCLLDKGLIKTATIKVVRHAFQQGCILVEDGGVGLTAEGSVCFSDS